MKRYIKPIIKRWKPGDEGYACLPLALNLPDMAKVTERHPDWKLIRCPICGEDCWESEAARSLKSEGVDGVCTLCAIRLGGTK